MYAVMVCLDGKDDWIYITENTGESDIWDIRPVLFKDLDNAMLFADKFSEKGKEENVQVVTYKSAWQTPALSLYC